MPNYRIDLAYDGSPFYGYARQPDVPTVQGVLEEALFAHVGKLETFVAGRTDKGVHATGQVVSFAAAEPIDHGRIARSLNRQLAPAIVILDIRQQPEDFHARHSATGRRYHYLVLNRETPDPFLDRIAWHYMVPLDIDSMNQAVTHMVGVHDFASLCRKAPGRSTIRELRTVEWSAVGATGVDGALQTEGLLRLNVWASSFCHQMVRSIVAVSVDVGRGKLVADDVPDMLAALNRRGSRGAAPSRGLTLVAVDYD